MTPEPAQPAESPEEELAAGKDELRRLMDNIWRAEYLNEAPHWKPLDDLAGMVTQIDNMYAGVREQRDQALKAFAATTAQPVERSEAMALIDRETAARTAFRAIQPAMDKIADAKPSEASPFTSGGMLRAAEMIADALRAMPAATTARPTERGAVQVEHIEAECARLLAAYLTKEIGSIMHQAEHWAANGKPLAVHHRLMKADDYFQILCLMTRDTSKGWKPPFDEIRDALNRKNIYEPGAYPPNADLYRYRDPAFVVAAVATQPATGRTMGGEGGR